MWELLGLRGGGVLEAITKIYGGIELDLSEQQILIPNDVEQIKTSIYSYGPVLTTLTVYSDFSYYDGGCYSHGGQNQINHAVVLIGWDDEICPEGAWLAKNGWGPGCGDLTDY